MDFLINDNELAALCGLPHMQQLVYLRGIRPYMDVKTGVVGIKRGVSYQSIAEQLYIEPHQGIKSGNFSRMQVRRALSALERIGVISSKTEGLKLILKCELATQGYFMQNKVDLNQTQYLDSIQTSKNLEKQENFLYQDNKANLSKSIKADTPLKDNNYIYFLSQFEKFWHKYPEKKSRQSAWHVFLELAPDNALLNQIIYAIDKQIKYREAAAIRGLWLPPWKYPANWLAQKCWEDELIMDKTQEIKHATSKKNIRNEPTKDMFWVPGETNDSERASNVIQFGRGTPK